MRLELGILLGIVIAISGFGAGYAIRSRDCDDPRKGSDVAQVIVKPTLIAATPTNLPLPTQTASPSVTPATAIIFTNFNIAGVGNKPTAETVFNLVKTTKIHIIQNYHWNSARGKTPGTIGIKSATGKIYGPWPASGSPGQGGVADAYWTVTIDEEFPAGTYTIMDSDPASWAQNSGTRGAGMSQVIAVTAD